MTDSFRRLHPLYRAETVSHLLSEVHVARFSRLRLERLEDRCVPATWGNPWPDATHLTVSFAPDGTLLAGQNSNLFATLNASAPSATWQRQILRAFQTWAAVTGVNLGVVGDGGQAFGVAGRPQSDSRFGDVRVGAAPYSGDVLIFSSPFDLTGGTASGDVRFNSAMWAKGSPYDLYTAMLQEAGHVLGVGNSGDPASVMYETYSGVRAGLSAGDVASVQTIYGTRLPDVYEGSAGNNTLGTASRLSLLADSNGLLSVAADADLGKGDRDFYTFTAPNLLGSLQITLQHAGLSLLTPRVTVYNSAGKVVGSAVSTDPTSGDLTINVGGITPLGTYRVSVEGASGDVFDVGSYRLVVRSLPIVNNLLGGLTGTVTSVVGGLTSGLLNNDLHTNDSFLTSGLLGGLLGTATTATPSQFDVSYRASISDKYDVDYYRVVAGQGGVMQVMAWGINESTLLPRVSVFDANRSPLNAEVLTNEGGVVTVQLTGATAGATYYVAVSSAVSSGTGVTGNYFLGIDFTDRAVQLTALADSQLDATKPSEQGKLSVLHADVFHFVLGSDGAGMGVEMTITDRQGTVVGRLRADNGAWASLTLILNAGDYTVRMTAYSTDGGPIRPVRYHLRGIVLSDPIGPQPEDTTCNPSPPPSGQSSAPPPSQMPPDQQQPTYSSSWYSWYGPSYSGGTYGGPSPQDPSGPGYTA